MSNWLEYQNSNKSMAVYKLIENDFCIWTFKQRTMSTTLYFKKLITHTVGTAAYRIFEYGPRIELDGCIVHALYKKNV